MFKNKKYKPLITLVYAIMQIGLTICLGIGAVYALEQKDWIGMIGATIFAAWFFAKAVKNLLRANAEVNVNNAKM